MHPDGTVRRGSLQGMERRTSIFLSTPVFVVNGAPGFRVDLKLHASLQSLGSEGPLSFVRRHSLIMMQGLVGFRQGVARSAKLISLPRDARPRKELVLPAVLGEKLVPVFVSNCAFLLFSS